MGDLSSCTEQGASDAGRFAFDPYVGAAVLRKLSELASREPALRVIDPGERLYVCASEVLLDAKGWLDQYRTPFDYFAGDALLPEGDRQILVSADAFAATLASAALEIVTIARLIELREVRAARLQASSAAAPCSLDAPEGGSPHEK